jgi:tetratricopeptide (TPR) repeat protein
MRVLACALGALAIGCSGAARSPCEQQAKAEQWRAAYAACVLEYPASHSVDVAFRLGNAALRIGRYDEGVTFVTPLLTGARAADAHGLLGSLELQRENLQQARVHARIASTLHQFMGNDAGRARDEHQLAGAQFKLGEYALALENGDQARAAAVRAHDDRMQVFVDIAQADILRELGDLKRAEIVARRARGAAVAPADRVLADLKLAIVLLEGDGWGLSGPFLFDALGLQLTLQNGSDLLLQSLYLNIALYERLSGNYPAALVAVEDARRARPDDLLSYRLNRGLVLSDMGRHSEAIADLADAETQSLSGEWSWWVPFQRAIAEERAGRSFEHAMGDGKPTAARSWWEVLQGAAAAAHLEDAIRADGRATERVAELAAKSGRFGPTVIASHRGPHLHLIGVLASQQRWPDVLEVVATMDAQSLLDSQEASGRSPVGSVAAMAASPRPHFEVASGPRAPSILEAWRGRRLLIIVPGGEHVWRLELVDGTLSATAVGEPAALGKLASTLEKDPGDAAVARALGELGTKIDGMPRRAQDLNELPDAIDSDLARADRRRPR